MRVSWADTLLIFMLGVLLTTFGFISLLLRGGCTCSFGKELSLEDLDLAISLMAIPIGAWVIGAIVSIIKNRR